MIKIKLLLGLLIIANISFAQNKMDTALKVVDVLHKKEFNNTFNLPTKANDSIANAKKEATYKKELRNKLAIEYSNQFNNDELNSLLTFYSSKVGEKVLKNKTKNSSTLSQLASNMEQKHMEAEFGIVPINNELEIEQHEPIVETASLNAANSASPAAKLIEEDIYGEIKTLEDLKKILLKDPHLIPDITLVKKILGEDVDIDKLMFPEP